MVYTRFLEEKVGFVVGHLVAQIAQDIPEQSVSLLPRLANFENLDFGVCTVLPVCTLPELDGRYFPIFVLVENAECILDRADGN